MTAALVCEPAAPPSKPAGASRLGGPWLPVLGCALLNLAVLAAVAAYHPAYLRDSRECNNPDARHYVLLGQNFFLAGHYSRCSAPPYHPDYLRTPVYPLFAGGLDLLLGAGGIYVTQALLHAASCGLLFGLVAPYFGRRAAFWASLLLATDLMLVVSNFEPMSEPLFLFLVLAAARCLVPAVLEPGDTAAQACRLGFGGALLALAILTRPAGLYLPVVFAALLVAAGLWRRRLARSAALAGVLLVTALAPVGTWVARNYAVFSVARLTHADAIMLVYFTGAGAYQVEHGLTLEEAQDRIGREFDLPPPHVTNNHWLTDQPIAAMDAQLRAAKWPVLTRYPKALALSSLLGTVKATFSHNVGPLAAMTGREWVAPGTGALLRADPGAFGRLAENGPLLAAAFAWQTGHNLLTWALAPVGLALALLAPQRRPFGLALLALLVYFHLTVAVVGAEAVFRSRTPHMPYVFALAGLALARPGRRPLPAA